MSSNEEEEDIYEVECILDKKKKKDGIYYLVKWLGYPLEDSTWEHEVNLEGAPEIVKDFENLMKSKKAKKPKRHIVSKAKLIEQEKINQKKKKQNEEKTKISSKAKTSKSKDNKTKENSIEENNDFLNDDFNPDDEDETPFKSGNILDNIQDNEEDETPFKSGNILDNIQDNDNDETPFKSGNISDSIQYNDDMTDTKINDLPDNDKNNTDKENIISELNVNNKNTNSLINNNKTFDKNKNFENNKNIKPANNVNKQNINDNTKKSNLDNIFEKLPSSDIINKSIPDKLNKSIENEEKNTENKNINDSNINWTMSNINFNSLKRKINLVDNELEKKHNYLMLRSFKKLKLIKGIERKIKLDFKPKFNSDISILSKERRKNETIYRIKTKNGKYITTKAEKIFHCKQAINDYKQIIDKKKENESNIFINKIYKEFDNTHYKRCIYCENEPNPDFQDPIYEDLGPFYSCTKCTSSYHIECIPGYKKNKKQYESNTDICKLCRKSEPTCQVNCIHKGKNEEYLKKIEALKFFRCSRCDLSAHFDCIINEIKKSTEYTEKSIIKYLKSEYLCHRCVCWNAGIDKILTYRDVDDNKKEFLIKFKNTSYLHVDWVPEDWIKIINDAKYNLFMNEVKKDNDISKMYGKPPVWPKSEKEVIKPEYYKVEMILDVVFYEKKDCHDFYNNENDNMEVNIEEFEKKLKRILVKWEGLPFSESSWEDYPDPEQNDIMDYRQALEYFIEINNVGLSDPMSYDDLVRNDPYFLNRFKELNEQDSSLIGGTLKDYQIDGVNWLLYKWTKRQSCILADEMGLGKTIQIIAFLASLKSQYNCFPFLIICPLSTIDNWYREFKKWIPSLIVVKYEGERNSRNIISQYLLHYKGTNISSMNRKSTNCHVVLTTPSLFRVDYSLFKSAQPKWEVIIVDEGHCLKTENGRLVNSIIDLNVDFKVILTGTPLQNTIQELYNILYFLDPIKFHDSRNKQSEYETLDEESLKEIRETLKPYMLRRSKSLVLKLPPKTETIVPVSMTSLQKRVYKGILEKNFHVLTSEMKKKSTSSSSSNVLMELKKCLNHPYLNNGIEPEFKDIEEEHTHLIDACAKFQLLKIMLKKLKEQNHRVLIFSTMKILLDLLERFLDFEHYKYTRLDGETSNRERQRRIDAFNAPDSDIFIFLLSTRAGGQGINLATADTIIMYDHDWNPQADIQALSRAHRIGQKNLVAAYKLVTKDSAEERIIQVGNRKLALDQLIVNSLSKNKNPIMKEDMLSILRHGAKSLFEENEQEQDQSLRWDEKSVEELLNRTRIPPVENNEDKETRIDNEFSFAKVWTVDKTNDQNQGHLESIEKESEESSDPLKQDEFWDNLLKEREQQHIRQLSEKYGVGKRKRYKLNYYNEYDQHFNKNVGEESNDNYSTETEAYSDFEENIDIPYNEINALTNIDSTAESTSVPSIKSKGDESFNSRPPCWLCLQEYHPIHLCPSIIDRSLIYSRYIEISQQPLRSIFQAMQLQILEFYLSIGANNTKVYIETDLYTPTHCYYCNKAPYHPPNQCEYLYKSPQIALTKNQRLSKLPYFKNDPNINHILFNQILSMNPSTTTTTSTDTVSEEIETTPWKRYLNAIKTNK